MSTFTQNFTLTATSGATPPKIAADAGLTQLVFADDFTDPNTVATSTAPTTGKNWYMLNSFSPPPVVTPSLTAATVNNRNNGPGPNASPNGGLMAVYAANASDGNAVLMSMSAAVADSSTSGPGCWLHFYAEYYVQFDYTVVFDGWFPGVWSGNVFNRNGIPQLPRRTEIDFQEWNGGQPGQPTNTWGSALHDWAVGNPQQPTSSTSLPRVVGDSNWHTYGMLWKDTSAQTGVSGTGSVEFFMDPTDTNFGSVGGPTATGTGTAYPATELYPLVLLIANGHPLPFYWDWVRVWAAPGSQVTNTPHIFNPPNK